MAASRIVLENFEKDQKRIDLSDGTYVVLGSTLDAMVVDPTVPKPRVELTSDQWKEIKTRKAVQGWVDSGAIRVFA